MDKRNVFFSFLHSLVFPAILLTASSCDDTVCSSFSTTSVIVRFFDSVSQKPLSIKFDSITSIGTDSVFYKADSLNTYMLPVNTGNDSTVFVFFSGITIDTLTVGYSKREKLISEVCGFELTYGSVQTGFTTFPMVLSLDNDLSTLNDSNVEIYY